MVFRMPVAARLAGGSPELSQGHPPSPRHPPAKVQQATVVEEAAPVLLSPSVLVPGDAQAHCRRPGHCCGNVATELPVHTTTGRSALRRQRGVLSSRLWWGGVGHQVVVAAQGQKHHTFIARHTHKLGYIVHCQALLLLLPISVVGSGHGDWVLPPGCCAKGRRSAVIYAQHTQRGYPNNPTSKALCRKRPAALQ